jgi:AcrR family transcriptional regulator
MATRDQVAAAARALFAEYGYVITTIAGIAAAADIPVQTIYSAFRTKAAILKEIAWKAVSQIDVDRLHEEALAEPDPVEALRIAAGIQCRQYEVMYDVIAVYQEAARTDAEIANDLARIMANRERGFRKQVQAIAAHLPPGMSVDDGLAIYQTLVLPEVFRTLVVEGGWSTERYGIWLADTLAHQLVRDAG